MMMKKIGAPEKMKDDCDDNTITLTNTGQSHVRCYMVKCNSFQDVFILSAFFI